MFLWLPVISLLLLILTMLFVHNAAPAGLVSVEGPVKVSRGGTVNLRTVLDFKPELLPPASECRVTHLERPGTDCGRVSPNIFNCRKYTGAIIYQHHGCFATLELANFMLSVLPQNYSSVVASRAASSSGFSSLQPLLVNASVFSVEVHVKETHSLFRALRVEVTQADTSNSINGGGVLNLTLVFPPSMLGHCHYEIISGWRRLQLPMGGYLEGRVNQPLPCGYVPMSPLAYHPHPRPPEVWDHIHTDYILIKIYAHKFSGHPLENAYGIFGFRTNGMTGNASNSFGVVNEVVELKRDFIRVRQAANAPVSTTNFTSSNLTLSLATFGGASLSLTAELDPLLRYTFPILGSGSFLSLHSTSESVSYSAFSSKELRDGHVSFHPTDYLSSDTTYSYNVTTTYSYNVTTLAGVLIARGEMVVLATRSEWTYPTQRRNIPLNVLEGGWAPINEATLHFYLLLPCYSIATMRALRPPTHGHLVYNNGSLVGNAQVLLITISNTNLLRYQHSGDEALFDVIYWEVLCSPGPPLQVAMSVFIAAVDDTPPTLYGRSEMDAYRNWAVAISPSLFQPADLDSPLESIHFRVIQLQGYLVRIDNNITLSNSRYFLPFMSKSTLQSYIQEGVSVFGLRDLEEQRIWYVPGNASPGEVIELTVNDSINEGPEIYNLFVNVSAHQPNQSLVISTTEEYPYILKNRPLPLSHRGHMYLSAYFLFSQAPPVRSLNVKYEVLTPPRHGYLCAVNHDPCLASLRSFTQADIGLHHVIYWPKNETRLSSDNFTFGLTVQGFHHANNIGHTFNFTASSPEIVDSDTPLVLNTGSATVLTTQHFSIFSSLLQTTNLTFQILEPPHFGGLVLILSTNNRTGAQSLARRSAFSYDDLIGYRLSYNSTHHRTLGLCTDQVLFEVSSPNKMQRGRLPIALRSGEGALSVTTQPHTLVGLRRFCLTSAHISVSSSFCAEWVVLVVRTITTIGHLSVKDHTRKTERQLTVGSRFTAKDLKSGLVCYSLLSSRPILSNASDSFTFTSTDPSFPNWLSPPTSTGDDNSGGDGEGGDGVGSDAVTSNFTVLLVPPPNIKDYILELNLSSRNPLTWLPRYQAYGYTILPSDITHLNTTLPLPGVLLQLEIVPIWGNMLLNQTLVSSFTVSDILSGRITYLKNQVVSKDIFRERLELGVYAYLPNTLRLVGVHHYMLEWAVLGFNQESTAVSENQGTVQLTIRRTGATWFQSKVTLVTISDSAVAHHNCSSPLAYHTANVDFCHLVQLVVFDVGVVSQDVSILLLDDEVAEGVESFYVQLLEGEGLTNAIVHGNVVSKIIITDVEDYYNVSIRGEPSPTSGCSMEVNVKEWDGKVTIPIIRDGFTDQDVEVICYTKDVTTSSNADYVARPYDTPESVVRFGVNISMAECVVMIIDDKIYEVREHFLVHLETTPTHSFVSIDPMFASLCVFISHDENDGPEVTFTESFRFVQESKTENKFVNFTLIRTGQDLNLTTMVKYNSVLRPGDTAMVDLDYEIYKSCTLDGDTSPGGCVHFSPGQIDATLTVRIIPDLLLEGNETFHLRIVYVRNGRRSSRLSNLEIIIGDATRPTYVEFVESSVTVSETSGFNFIALKRHGYLKAQTNVRYRMRGETALGGINEFMDDFIITSSAVNVNFTPGQTDQICSVLVLDDNVFEGNESFVIWLEAVSTNETEMILSSNTSSVRVFITDPEDFPVVQFATPTSPDGNVSQILQVEEPLSNSSIDQSLLSVTLTRSRDVSFSSTVTLSALDQTARNGRDFIFDTTNVVFPAGNTSISLTVPVLANHLRHTHSTFTLQLSGPVGVRSGLNIDGYNNSVEVVIMNQELEGPYFSALPQLDNVEDGVRSYSGGRYHDLTLICITPCDNLFDNPDQNIQRDCRHQKIDNSQTLYSWETSIDGGHSFNALNSSTIYTSTHSRELQTLYLAPGIHVRCRVQAVDHLGRRGYWRQSEMVRQGERKYSCYGTVEEDDGGLMKATLTSYESYKAMDQDMVELEVTLPARPNSIPIVSTSALTSHVIPQLILGVPAASTSAPTTSLCSTLNFGDGHSLLTHTLQREGDILHLHPHPLFQHTSRPSCLWRFSVWLPLKALLQDCGGKRRSSSAVDTVTVQVVSVYVNFMASDVVFKVDGSQTVALAVLERPVSYHTTISTASLLPPPLHTLSQAGHLLPHIFPIAISKVPEEEDLFRLFVYSAAPPQQLFLISNHSYLDPRLLYTNMETGTQVWTLLLNGGSQPLQLGMTAWGRTACTHCVLQVHHFTLLLNVSETGKEISVGMFLDARAILLDRNEKLLGGDHVRLTIDLSPLQQVQREDLMLHMRQLLLCEQVGPPDACSNRLTVLGSGENSRFDVHINVSSNRIGINFSTEAIVQVTSPSHWSLRGLIDLSPATSDPSSQPSPPSSSYSSLYGAVTLSFTIYSANDIITTHSTSSSILYHYIAVLFPVITVLVLLLCVGGFTVVACASHGKAKFQMHASLARANQQQLAYHRKQQLNCASLQCRKSGMKCLREKEWPLKKSNSTIGFPTREGKAKWRPITSRTGYSYKKKRDHDEKNHLGKALRRTRSLPTLYPSTALINLPAPLSTRRLNLNKVHTRIKRVDVEQPRLHSQSKQLIFREQREKKTLLEQGGKKILVEQCAKKILVEHGGKKTLVEQGAKKLPVEQGNMKTLVEQGAKKILVEHGGKKILVEHGDKKTLVEKGSKKNLVEQGNKKTLVEQGGKKTLVEKRGKKNLVEQGRKKTLRKEGGIVVEDGKMAGGNKPTRGSQVAEDSFHGIQDYDIRHKLSGMNEAPLWREEKTTTSSYATYMVHSLATSARTPEPGSYPTTQL